MQLTQLNSVQPISAKQVSRVELSWVGVAKDTSPTQLNTTQLDVELSCVAINGYVTAVGLTRPIRVSVKSVTSWPCDDLTVRRVDLVTR